MGAFGEDLKLFAEKVTKRTQLVFHRSTETVQESVQDGSAITGAPGQPVDTGNLKGSWIQEFESADIWKTSTGVEYAVPIEEGIGPHGPLTLRSVVGGFHSVAMTRAAWDNIVEDARKKVVGNG